MLRVAFLSALQFISIADEKVARVFEAPREFLQVVKNLGIVDLHADIVSLKYLEVSLSSNTFYQTERPRAATVPPLGLSNKAILDSESAGCMFSTGRIDQRSASAQTDDASIDQRTTRRPFEGELAVFTLWPETEKVFGHGYEVCSEHGVTKRKFTALVVDCSCRVFQSQARRDCVQSDLARACSHSNI